MICILLILSLMKSGKGLISFQTLDKMSFKVESPCKGIAGNAMATFQRFK